jgi:hypothetical protein
MVKVVGDEDFNRDTYLLAVEAANARNACDLALDKAVELEVADAFEDDKAEIKREDFDVTNLTVIEDCVAVVSPAMMEEPEQS